MDYPTYGISIEKVKIAFRLSYSLLDKISYFINEYFLAGRNPDHIYFRTIWFSNRERKELHPNLKNKHNLPLRGLYWLSKDIFDEELGFRDYVEPDAQKFQDIRNQLEHKYFKVHDLLSQSTFDPINVSLRDDLAYSIGRCDFEQKTLRLLRLVRNALIYLSLAIHSEEKERNKRRNPSNLIVPMISDFWEDDWKR